MKQKLPLALLLSACLITIAFAPLARAEALPLGTLEVVIDPGHGGPDPGANRDGITEKEIVLNIALKLRQMLASSGANVVLTRDTDVDLADSSLGNKYSARKRQDIKRRVELVNSTKPAVLISLHVNAIADERWRGAQVFYKIGMDEAKSLAEAVQANCIGILGNTDRSIKPGDYKILNDVSCPAILVEVGFISNPAEAGLLVDQKYQEKVAWSIYVGLQQWLAEQR